MKLSRIIKELKDYEEIYGDIECYVQNVCENNDRLYNPLLCSSHCKDEETEVHFLITKDNTKED